MTNFYLQNTFWGGLEGACRKVRWATTEECGARRKIVLVRMEKKEQRERYGVQSTVSGA